MEQNKLEKQYEAIYKARLSMVKPYAELSTKNPKDANALKNLLVIKAV
jgi:hypothetical protein